MQAHQSGGIDLDFRPKSYFWPADLRTHLLSRIKGRSARRRSSGCSTAIVQKTFPISSAKTALTSSERQALGRIHPAFMGGEYLPDLKATETMIARITIASTTQDVTSVYARRGKGRIYYRVVDEYEGETLSGKIERTSSQPLSLRELDSFFSAAWSVLDVLEMNFGDSGYDEDEMQAFVVEVGSSFYPDLDGSCVSASAHGAPADGRNLTKPCREAVRLELPLVAGSGYRRCPVGRRERPVSEGTIKTGRVGRRPEGDNRYFNLSA